MISYQQKDYEMKTNRFEHCVPGFIITIHENLKILKFNSDYDYGIITCLGTIDKFLDKSVVLNLGCSGRNQDDEKFTGNIVRKSDAQDAGVGVFTYVDGTGKFERMIGRKCNLAVRYIDEFTFYRHRCK